MSRARFAYLVLRNYQIMQICLKDGGYVIDHMLWIMKLSCCAMAYVDINISYVSIHI